MAKEKKSTPTTSKETLQDKLDKISFKNKEIADIRKLQTENAKLKDAIGRKESVTRQSSVGSIQGLQRLRNTLGTQNISK